MNFYDKIDRFGEQVEKAVVKRQTHIANQALRFIKTHSPQPGIAPYATGEYLESNIMRINGEQISRPLQVGDVISISPDTDHDFDVETGAFWPVSHGYFVYAKAAVFLRGFIR